MNRNRREIILETLSLIHMKSRLKQDTISNHTKSAINITREWQDRIKTKLNDFSIEKELYEDSHEKIDAIDLLEKTAYELKVSGKNPHHEFYKDIFKVLIYNEEHPNEKIKTFVFITEKEGVEVLEERPKRIISFVKDKHNLDIEFEAIP